MLQYHADDLLSMACYINMNALPRTQILAVENGKDKNPMNREEQIKLEHSTLLEEYRTIREEIVSTLDSIRQMTNLTLTAVGVLIAGSPYIIQSQLPALFLVAPLFFYILSWIHIRHTISMVTLSDYLKDHVIPRIRQSIFEMHTGREQSFDYVMNWEEYFGRRRYFNLMLLPVTSSHYGLPLLTALFSLCAYFYIIYTGSQTIQLIDRILISLNAIAFVYSLIVGFWAQYYLHRRRMKPQIAH